MAEFELSGAVSADGMAAARAALGRSLKEKRTKAKKTQQEIAQAVGVDRTLYSRWENGERVPNYKQWQALSEFFGVRLSELAPRNQYPSAPMDPDERAVFFQERNKRIQNAGKHISKESDE